MSGTNRKYLCTCQIKHAKSGKKHKDELRHLKFHETEVDADECCVYCGYYAWEMPMHIRFPRVQTVPWRSEVQDENSVNAWVGLNELKDAYYGKTCYSDYEVDNGDNFDSSRIADYSIQEELASCYVRWGGNSNE